jgi:hypothetical protein
MKLYLMIGVIFVAALAGTAAHPARAETTVVFLSEKVEGTLVPAEGGGYETKEAIKVLVHNKGTSPVKISFCAMPDGQDTCSTQSVTVSIIGAEKTKLLSDEGFELEADEIKPLKLQVVIPALQGQGAAPEPSALLSQTSSPSRLPAWLQPIEQQWQAFVENKQPEAQTGQLVLLAGQAHAAAIPFTLTPETPSTYFLDNLSTEQVIVMSFILAVLAVALPVVTFMPLGPWARRIFPGYFQPNLSPGALWSLPMGKAEWKLEDSWVVNLSVAITILGGIQSILPDSMEKFKTSYSTLIFMFGVITAVAAFAYNAFTQPGPEKEEGKETYKKQGRTGFFLLTTLLVVWALLGQFGLQAMAVERLRDSEPDIPGEFLIAFEVGVYLMTAVVFASTLVTLRRTILEQKIEAHQQAYRQNAIYRGKVQRIRRYAARWMGILGTRRSSLSQPDINTIIRKFGGIVPLSVPAPLAREQELRERYQRFSELFHINLPALVRTIAHDLQATQELFQELTEDSLEAEGLLKQTLPLEEVVAAFYSCLWAPRDLRRKSYQEALAKISRHLRVACAQASSTVEPDRVIGPNEELYTNIKATLAALDKALGMAGKRDPIYTNLEKLLENAKQKWDVMKIKELETVLCRLSTAVDQCNKNVETYFEKKEASKEDTLGANLANFVLRPLATALGDNILYPKPFPIDTEMLDKEYEEKLSMTEAKKSIEKMKAARPKRKTGKEKQAGPEMTTARMVKQELQKLQKSIEDIEVSPYSASDTESQQNRIKALRQSGQQKVLGEDVSML